MSQQRRVLPALPTTPIRARVWNKEPDTMSLPAATTTSRSISFNACTTGYWSAHHQRNLRRRPWRVYRMSTSSGSQR